MAKESRILVGKHHQTDTESTDVADERRRLEQLELERASAQRIDLFKVIQDSPADFPIDCGSWNILIEMYEPGSKMGSIIKTQAQMDAEQHLTVVGRVLKVGITAFAGKTTSGIDCSKLTDHIQSPEELVGRYVIIQRYTGNEIYFAPFPAKKLRFITLQEILAVTTIPTMWMKN
jgi:hypothetical protein